MPSIEQIADLATAKQVAILLEDENRRLVKRLQQLTEEIARMKGESGVRQLELEIARLQQQTGKLQKELFGRSSERRNRHGKGNGSDKSKGNKVAEGQQAQLPVQPCAHKLDEADQVCELCGGQLREWEGQTEDSEEVTIIERQYVIHKHQRQKYICSCGAAPVTAPGPVKLMAGGRYSIEFAIDVAIAKYLDHMPLERQVGVMARHGLIITNQTLWDQLNRLAEVLLSCYQGVGRYVRSKGVLNVDETPWPFLDAPNKKWWVWSAASHDAVYYHFDPRRSTDAAEKLLDDFKGTLVVDGYISYESLLKRKPELVLAICWAHARRKFLEAEPYYPEKCAEILELIDDLFWVERRLPSWERLQGADQERALRVIADARRIHSRAIVKAIERWVLDQRVQPGSSLADAIDYLSGHFKGLTRFLDDPRIPMSNNRAERELRTCVVGRKNHYGSRSVRGTEVAALFYTLLESAKLSEVDPAAYLRAATRAILADPSDVLLPHQFAALQRSEQPAAA
jgi:transposase